MSDVKEHASDGKEHDEHERAAPPRPTIEVDDDDVPDPDEDYLDDLDDVLEEFSAPTSEVKPHSSGSAPTKSAEDQKPTKSSSAEEDEFAKQLEAGMADLLDELAETPEVRQQLEHLVKDLGQAAGSSSSSGDGPSRPPAAALHTTDTSPEGGGGGASFQDTIQRTMRRMQESNAHATAAAATGDNDADDVLAEMLKQLRSSSGEGGGGVEGGAEGDHEEEFSKLLLGMMEQLTTKEILYAPMTELNDKFPAWMETNGTSVSVEDRRRYDEQRRLVGEIVARFERDGYADANAADREYIVERMQQMQAAGAPPAELVGNMDAAQDALNDLDAGCPQQ